MSRRILFRVDANSAIGFGHLTRCVSIAKSLSNFELFFASTEEIDSYLQNQLSVSFLKLERSQDFFSLLKTSDLVILDGYQFDTEYYTSIEQTGAKIIAIDDLANQVIPADLIINTAPRVEQGSYRSHLYTKYYTGLNYALLRPSFLELACEESNKKIKLSLMICFGGADPLNKTETALLTALSSGKFEDIHVVLGPAYGFQDTINKISETHSKIRTHVNLNESKMSELMRNCETAILPCSGILQEGLAAKMKVISGYYIKNQKHNYKEHLKLGSFVDAKKFSADDILTAINKLDTYSVPNQLIDGKSIERIVRAIEGLASEDKYTIKKATIEDLKPTFDWANSPNTREFSFSKEEIKWEEHSAWFTSKINSPACKYFILWENKKPVGSIRFDIENGIAKISYLVDPMQTGKGIGTLLMKLGLKRIAEQYTYPELIEIHGYVIPKNIASVKTFERFDFRKQLVKDVFLYSKNFNVDV
jgi:UDP-2,4-diacetamido-2,4,6-trideoxy-beta-L-altropyranose hydrolase